MSFDPVTGMSTPQLHALSTVGNLKVRNETVKRRPCMTKPEQSLPITIGGIPERTGHSRYSQIFVRFLIPMDDGSEVMFTVKHSDLRKAVDAIGIICE